MVNERINCIKLYSCEKGLSFEIMNLPQAKYKYQRMQAAISNDCRCIDIQDVGEDLPNQFQKYCLVFDDEFLLKNPPILNATASYLYGYQTHGQPLCGNVLVMKSVDTDDGIDTVGLTDVEIIEIVNFLGAKDIEILEAMIKFLDKINEVNC